MHTLLVLALLGCGDKDGDDTGTDGGTADGGGTGDGGTTGAVVTREGCEERHEGFIAGLEADLAVSEAPGVSAAILEDGVVTCRIALGRKAEGSEEVPGIDTLFQLGSTTKMFTALALLQRVEDGALTLETTLAEAHPASEFDYDADWNDAITMHHLLTHQGGFYDYLDWAGASDDADLAAWHEEVYFPYLWLMADPGSFWNYSNPNFDLAGLVVEGMDERWFPDIMVQDVFGPLGMDRTFMRKSEAQADGDYATGVGYSYGLTGDMSYGAVPIDQVPDPAAARPAGAGTWSTPAQVLQMARFLMEGDPAVLSDALRQQMVTAQVSLELTPDDAGYGYGIFLSPGFTLGEDYYELELWDHGGNALSYSSHFYAVPSQGFAVSILDSGYASSFSTAIIAALEDLVELPAPVEPPPYEFDPARLDLHVGTYEDAYNVGEMIVTRVDDGLHISMPLLEELGYVVEEELEPISSDLWLLTLDGVAYDLTFLGAEEGGQSQWVRNRSFVGTRVEDEAVSDTAGPDTAAVADRAALRRALVQGQLRPGPRLGPPPRR